MSTKKVQVVSTRKRSLNKTKVDIRSTRKKKVEDKPSESNEKNIIVTRRRNAISKETDNDKDKKITKKRQKSSNKSLGLRQLSLKESFSKRLRPRPSKDQDNKNIAQKNLSPRSQRSVVVLNKILIPEKIKKPVYKHINFSDDSIKDKRDVYNFDFDLNDTTEKMPKKKKKRTTKTNLAKHPEKKVQIKVRLKHLKQTKVPKKDVATTMQINEPEKDVAKKKISKRHVSKTSEANVPQQNTNIIQVKRPVKRTQNAQIKKVEKVRDEEKPKNLVKSAPKVAVDKNVSPQVLTPEISIPEALTPEVQTSKIISPDNDENKMKKPTVRSVEKLTNTKITVINPTKPTTKISMPFRPININNKPIIQYKHMTDHSLLNKSLSPITKAFQNFDVGSPWRPPPLSSFSHVKNLFQSTPAIKANSENLVKQVNIQNTIQSAAALSEKNTNNLKSQKIINVDNEKEKVLIPLSRRFGTEITNVDHSTSSTALNNSKYNNIMEDKENALPNYQTPRKSKTRRLRNIKRTLSLQKVATLQSSLKKENLKSELLSNSQKEIASESNKTSDSLKPVSDLQESEFSERENMMLLSSDMQANVSESTPGSFELQRNIITNKENILKKSNSEQITELEPQPGPSGLQKNIISKQRAILTESNNQQIRYLEPQPGPSGLQRNIISKRRGILTESNCQEKENVNPKPGPSGIQKETVSKPEKVLRQSNLSNFLNLPEMPEISMIRTAHGIFDDAHSTPVTGKPLKKIQPLKKRTEPAIENAFGFSESDSDLDISPINPEVTSTNIDKIKPKVQVPLAPARLSIGEIKNKLLKRTQPVKEKNEETKKDVETKKNVELKTKKQFVDAVNFSDTFDVLSESEETSRNMIEVPLFVDLEPTHFTEPPKRSYKRKRAVQFDLSDESDQENADIEKPEVKRKKKREKLNKEEEKRLKEWVQNVNQTFSEIDEYDLVIE